MTLTYKIDFKDGMFKYDCIPYSSYLKIRAEDMEKIYSILNKIDVLKKQYGKDGATRIDYNGFAIIFDYNGFAIIFDCNGSFAIQTTSNWLNIKEEVPIIKRELIKYIEKYDIEHIKDIIIKIKSLKKGSSNRIKEDLK